LALALGEPDLAPHEILGAKLHLVRLEVLLAEAPRAGGELLEAVIHGDSR
jgi:hypothetical protein